MGLLFSTPSSDNTSAQGKVQPQTGPVQQVKAQGKVQPTQTRLVANAQTAAQSRLVPTNGTAGTAQQTNATVRNGNVGTSRQTPVQQALSGDAIRNVSVQSHGQTVKQVHGNAERTFQQVDAEVKVGGRAPRRRQSPHVIAYRTRLTRRTVKRTKKRKTS